MSYRNPNLIHCLTQIQEELPPAFYDTLSFVRSSCTSCEMHLLLFVKEDISIPIRGMSVYVQ